MLKATRTALLTSAALLVSVAMASAQDTTTSEEETSSPQTEETTEPATEPADDTAASTDAPAGGEIISLPGWHTDITPENAMSVERIFDFDVYGPEDEEIGSVENVLFGTEGQVLSVIAEVGGIWDIGDTHVNVPWDEVEVDAAAERITIPVTQDTVEDYTLFTEEVVAAGEASTGIDEVEGDALGLVDTGPRVWQARELINDYVRLKDGDEFVNYGFVDDILVKDGQLEAVVVRPDTTWGTPGLYAYPYYGYGYGWYPGLAYYDLPYNREDVAELEPLDEEVWDD